MLQSRSKGFKGGGGVARGGGGEGAGRVPKMARLYREEPLRRIAHPWVGEFWVEHESWN